MAEEDGGADAVRMGFETARHVHPGARGTHPGARHEDFTRALFVRRHGCRTPPNRDATCIQAYAGRIQAHAERIQAYGRCHPRGPTSMDRARGWPAGRRQMRTSRASKRTRDASRRAPGAIHASRRAWVVRAAARRGAAKGAHHVHPSVRRTLRAQHGEVIARPRWASSAARFPPAGEGGRGEGSVRRRRAPCGSSRRWRPARRAFPSGSPAAAASSRRGAAAHGSAGGRPPGRRPSR